MPGSLPPNIRRGLLQEDLGVYLLKGLAAVAHVPQSDDSGIDAIATLLRRESPQRLMAGRSFYVQIKAASIEEVSYSGPALSWMKRLRLPFFIARVEPTEQRISLYTCHRALDALTHFEYLEVKLILGPSPNEEDSVSWKKDEQIDAVNHRTTVWLGPPVISWTASEMMVEGFQENSYSILNPLLSALDMNIIVHETGWVDQLKWDTGKRAVRNGFGWSPPRLSPRNKQSIKTTQEYRDFMYRAALPTITGHLFPFLASWGLTAIASGRGDDWLMIRPILTGYGIEWRQIILNCLDRTYAQGRQFEGQDIEDGGRQYTWFRILINFDPVILPEGD